MMPRNQGEKAMQDEQTTAPDGPESMNAPQPANVGTQRPNVLPQPGVEPESVGVTPDSGVPPRTAPMGTVERFSIAEQDAPRTNREVRNAAALQASRLDFGDAEERLRRQTLGEAGEEPQHIEHHVVAAAPAGGNGGAPGAFFGQSTTYVLGERDIFSSSVGQVITSYTLDSTAVTADANGDKIVYEGTVLQASGAKVAPRTTGTAVGILRHRINVRNGDAEIGMVIGGRVRSDKCWDNGTFGTIAAGAVTSLNALGIYFTTYDA